MTDRQQIIRDSLEDAEYYARAILRLNLHDWQGKLLERCSAPGTRRRIAVRAPNGAGKDDRVIAPLALWWLRRYAKGTVVITGKDDSQIENQTWRSIRSHDGLFTDCRWTMKPRKIYTPTGGELYAFVTDEEERAEGYHMHEPEGPLLMIINEAKSVDDGIFDRFDRCSYSLLLEISSGGPMRGRFYEHFTSKSSLYETYAISLQDCPHIPREKIEQTIAEYGENDPHTRSTIFGEFMATDERISHVFELPELESNRAASIPQISGPTIAAVDFAAGRANNVLIKRTGNFVPEGCIKGWRDRDTHAAIGRFVYWFNQLGLRPNQIFADADGLGAAMCSDLDAVGWKVNRFHGGIPAPGQRYKNLSSYAWHEVANMVRHHRIAVPNHPQLIAELSARRVKYATDGRLWMETKEEMADRGVASPDFADAFCMAFAMQPIVARSWVHEEDTFKDVAKRHGWEYNGDNDDQSGGRPGSQTEYDSWVPEGFGGVHSTW